MKIAILGTRGVPNRYGGFEQIAEYVSIGLVAKGHDVTVYCPNTHEYNAPEFQGVKIKKIYCPEDKLGAAAHFIYDYLSMKDALKQDFDILYENGYGTSVFAYYLLNANSPIVVTSMDGLEWKRSKWNFLTRKLMKQLEKIALKKSDFIISDNVGIQEYYQEAHNQSSFYIPSGGEIPEIFEEKQLQSYGLLKDNYYVLMARMEPENNIEMILDGYLLSGAKEPFIVIGGTTTKHGQYLLDKYKNHASIQFIGGVYDRAVNQSIRHYCKIYFHGHTVGGTNPSLLEAMGDRAFIIANDNKFNRSVLCKKNLFFSSSEEIAVYLKEFNKYAPLKSGFIEGNLQRIREEFNWQQVIDDHERLFEELMAKNAGQLVQER